MQVIASYKPTLGLKSIGTLLLFGGIAEEPHLKHETVLPLLPKLLTLRYMYMYKILRDEP